MRYWSSRGSRGRDDFRLYQTGSFPHVLLHVLGVAQLVGLEVLAELRGVEDDDLLTEDAGVVDEVDDLPLGVPVVSLVLSEGQRVLLGHVLPQAGEEVKSVADVAEDSARHVGIVTQLPGDSHFARLF